ncbi:MAG: hypothetical protein QM813_27700 [Verrucomicrobiota bacterium]
METQAQALKAVAQKIADTSIQNLIREDLGPIGFKESEATFISLQGFMKRVAACAWNGVPQDIIQACILRIGEIFPHIDRITKFDALRSGNVAGEREGLARNLNSQFSACYSFICPHLSFAETNEGVNAQRSNLAKIIEEANKAKADIESKQGQAMKLVSDLEAIAQKSGVTKQAIYFKKLADQYLIASTVWLGVAVVFGFYLWHYVSSLHVAFEFSATTTASVLGAVFPRLISVTLLSTALIFCLKNFGALAHNVIVNRHRQTALTTFSVFVNSTEDTSTKNAVLIQATQAIFAPQPSGYLKNDTEMPQVNQITEIVRGVAGKDKP